MMHARRALSARANNVYAYAACARARRTCALLLRLHGVCSCVSFALWAERLHGPVQRLEEALEGDLRVSA
eukprot:6204439-Pleurochrysis_carterae.AAC.3